VSASVHALPSSQEAVLFAFTQPIAGLHESSVHTLPSLQCGGGPPTHTPDEHVSAVVQALPSSQLTVLGALVQPTNTAQKSSVQTLPSSQFGAAPPTQTPALQLSASVHGLPSSH